MNGKRGPLRRRSLSRPPGSPLLPPRREWRRHPPGAELWLGAGILAFYVAVALSALVVFRGTLASLEVHREWISPLVFIGPSWAHPFGVMQGFGVDEFTALWQATPWDLSIILPILAIDAGLGTLLGAIAGLYEGKWPDSVVTFITDSFGAIPSAFFAVIVFAGLALVLPQGDSLPVFVVLFGVILWPTCARTVRDRVRLITRETYVEAARASGATNLRVLFRHLIPESLDPVLAQIPIDIIAVFLVLSVFPWWVCVTANSGINYYIPYLPAFSPLPSATFPEWGYLLGNGACFAFPYPAGPIYWWMAFFPLVAFVLFGLGIALASDGLASWMRRGH